MNKLLIVLLLVAVTFVVAEEKKYGKEITLKEKTSVTSILADPGKFEGKTVLVEGKILGVCKEKGCWLDIAGEKENEKIRIKAVEHEIVFPQDALGKTALVEGVFAKVKKEAAAGKDKGKDKHKMTEQNKTGEQQDVMTDQQKKTEEKKHEKMADHSGKEGDMHSSMGMMKKAYQIQVIGAVIRE
ncbi:MAG: DUF4920 domain-containing protein [Bacteroidota bacterium]